MADASNGSWECELWATLGLESEESVCTEGSKKGRLVV